MEKKRVNRRKFLQHLGLGIGTGVIGSSLTKPLIDPNPEACIPTPIQELGPFIAIKYRKQADHDIDLTQFEGQTGTAIGQTITIKGKVTDKDCKPVKSAIVEIWSANHYGKYRHEFDTKGQEDPNFQGWGQAITNENGEYRFKTILPGLYGSRTRHVHFKISKRGYHELTTQLYFDGEERNNTDGVLNQLTHEEQLMIIKPLLGSNENKQIEFNIVIEEVLKGTVPEKVLKEYVGNYKLQFKGTGFEGFTDEVVGGPYKELKLKLTNHGTQMYMTLPFAPKTEIFWHQKDQFQAWAFYNSYLSFSRDQGGKITSLDLHFGGDEDIIKGIKQQKNSR